MLRGDATPRGRALGLASSAAAGPEAGGPTRAGKVAVVVGFVFAIGHGVLVTRGARDER